MTKEGGERESEDLIQLLMLKDVSKERLSQSRGRRFVALGVVVALVNSGVAGHPAKYTSD